MNSKFMGCCGAGIPVLSTPYNYQLIYKLKNPLEMRVQEAKNLINKPVVVSCKRENLTFKYFSDIVFNTAVFDIPILSARAEGDEYQYALDLAFLEREAEANQKTINNFSQIRSCEGDALVCLLVREHNQIVLAFP